MPLVDIRNISKRAGGKWALWDINLEIKEGEIITLFGRSESGKTTLASILAGSDEPTNGEIVWDEEEPQCYISLARSTPAFAPELTIYENLNLFASMWGINRRKRAKEITFLLELLKLSDKRSTKTGCLSSGALNRIEIAKALLADLPLTVIDSLLDTLDVELLEKVWDYMLQLRRNEQKSFLILTSFGRIAEMAGKMLVLHSGKIVYSGAPDNFRKAAGEDMVVLGNIESPMMKHRIQERFSVIISEEKGFLSFRVGNGERIVTDLLTEFGSDLGCVYLKKPTLEDALSIVSGERFSVSLETTEGRTG